MTVDVGDELREFIDSWLRPVITEPRAKSCVTRCGCCEKQAESRLQELRDLLAEGISSRRNHGTRMHS
jgi:antitoxin ParD1/3/4